MRRPRSPLSRCSPSSLYSPRLCEVGSCGSKIERENCVNCESPLSGDEALFGCIGESRTRVTNRWHALLPRHRHHPTAGRLAMLRKIASRNARKWATELPRGFESLEDRRLMTVSWALSNGVLTINGGNDTD